MSTAAGTFSIRGDLPPNLVEVETFSKPGTADVTAGDRKKLSGLLKHYAAMAHPFTTCVRDQIKHGLAKDHANRRCAVIKDLIKGTTKWRGKAKEEAALDVLAEALNFLQVASMTITPPTVAAILHEERLEEGEADLLFAVADHELSEGEQLQRAEEVLRSAAALVEAAPRWMIPVAARRPGFRPVKRQQGSGGKFDESKHRRAPKGTGMGGKFIRMGSTGSEVAAIQRRVGAAETGTFNKQTKERLEAFQRRKGIQVDGVVGTQTANAMHGNTSADPGRLTKHDRRFLRRYGKRTSASSTSPPPADRRRRMASTSSSSSSSSRPKPIPSPSEDSLPDRKAARLARQGWDYHDGMWWPPGHPRNKKGSSRRIVTTRRTVTR